MLKYVRLSTPHEGDVFVYTHAPLKHSDLAKILSVLGYQPKSAGFVSFDSNGTATTHGESESLKLRPLPDDAQRISLLCAATANSVPVMTAAPAAPFRVPTFG